MSDLLVTAYAEDRGLLPVGSVVRQLVADAASSRRFLERVLHGPSKRTWGECMWTAADLSGLNQPTIIFSG